jgi:hypothetical protein
MGTSAELRTLINAWTADKPVDALGLIRIKRAGRERPARFPGAAAVGAVLLSWGATAALPRVPSVARVI